MRKAVFEELKYGDKLVTFNTNGEFRTYTYLCRDPYYKDKYAFLLSVDNINAKHYYRPYIEELQVYSDFKEVLKNATEIKAKYYQEWLDDYNKKKQ